MTKRIPRWLAATLILVASSVVFGDISSPLEPDRLNSAYINFGYDYALFTLGLGYARGIELRKLNRQLVLNADVTLPMLEPDLSDWRARAGGAIVTAKSRKFIAPIHLNAIFRSAKNTVGRAMGFGTSLSFLPGICLSKFSANAELTWDQQWATHIEHSDEYRQWVFADAKDGWYSITAFTIRYGARIGVLVNSHIEVLLRGGYEQDGTYDYRTPPFYTILSVNKRF